MQVKSSRSAKFFSQRGLVVVLAPSMRRCQRGACLWSFIPVVRKLGGVSRTRVLPARPCGSSILPPAKEGVLRRREGGALNRRSHQARLACQLVAEGKAV